MPLLCRQARWVMSDGRAATHVCHETHGTNGAFCVIAGQAGAGCPYRAAVDLAQQPLVQLIVAACVAVAVMWYVM